MLASFVPVAAMGSLPDQVNTLLSCPAKWYFHYAIGLREPATGGRAVPPASRRRPRRSSQTCFAGVLDEQAERHGPQVLASEAHRETLRGRVLLGGDRRIDARRQRLL